VRNSAAPSRTVSFAIQVRYVFDIARIRGRVPGDLTSGMRLDPFVLFFARSGAVTKGEQTLCILVGIGVSE
jgi:hypothetical protein